MPIPSTNHPKPIFIFSSSAFLEIKFPIKIPIIDAKVNSHNNFQSMILFSVISPKKPINDWKETMKSDVPTAVFIGFFCKN